MKWTLMLALLVFGLVAYAPSVSAQATERHYTNYQDEFMNGYREGFSQGRQDIDAGLNFDYQGYEVYQTGSDDFQSGFERGYEDAFNRRSPQMNQSSRNLVEMFSATGFRGNRMALGVGSYDSVDLDDVESMRIYGDVKVTLFNEPNFEGRSITIMADAPNLRDMQRSTSFFTFGLMRHHTGSMIVERFH